MTSSRPRNIGPLPGRLRLLTMFVLPVVLVACAGGDVEPDQDVPSTDAAPTSSDEGERDEVGDVVARLQIGEMVWEFDSVVCITGTEPSLSILAPTDNVLDLSEPHVVINVSDPSGEGKFTGEGLFNDLSIRAVESGDLTLDWRSTSDHGAATVRVDGSRVNADGLFYDDLTPDVDEAIAGSIEVDCGDEIVASVAAATEPEPETDGFVTVGGETFPFTYGSPPQCGIVGTDGRIVSYGQLIEDPIRQVVFTYGLAENTSSGSPSMQIIIYGPDGGQLWYSQVGFGGGDTGSVDSISVDGATVAITGTLVDGSDNSVFAPFTAEATCAS